MPATDPSRAAPMRRLTILGVLFVAGILSCGKDVTGPLGAAARYVRGFSWNPEFPPAFQAAGGTSSGVVAFDRVHVVLHHSDGTVALDTVVDFPAGTDSITVGLTVKLLDNAPSAGEPMSLNLGYLDAAGDTVFKGGPVTVTAAPPPPGGGPNPPVQVPVTYVGPGANAVSVAISPRTATVAAGSNFSFSAVAKDAGGNTLAATPVIWNSLDPTIATITSAASGAGVAGTVRGTARIVAQLLTGPSDQVLVTVTLPAAAITAQSGSAQSGVVGTTLAQPLIVKVAASDGVGVAGVTVTFAVAGGGGSVATPSAVSDANGLAQTMWKLGSSTGAQSVTATSGALTNSPLTFAATALSATATKLAVTSQPANGVAGTALAPVAITAEDSLGNVATTFTGPVTVGLGSTTAGAVLAGTATVNAIAGVATFSTLAINKNGSAYTLVASSAGLAGATTSAFDIAVGAPNKLAFTVQPAGGTANAAMSPAIVVNAQDSQGNTTPAFTGAITLALATNPGAATLGGTPAATAVAGVATFPNITVSTGGAGYTLSASATGLVTATSAAFNIAGGVATQILISSGNAQSAPPGSLLAQPIVAKVADATGTGVAGKLVTFVVVTGGGSLSSASGMSDASGLVPTTWTLGATLGAQTISATSAGLTGSPLTFTATATVALASKVWTGATNNQWAVATNWSPAGVPVAGDSVLIPITSNNPVTTASVIVADLYVSAGATLNLNGGGVTLSDNGLLDATGGIIGTGSVVLNASPARTIKGTITAATVTMFGGYTLNGALGINGNFVINSAGSVVMNGNTMGVNGNFSTAGTGTFTENNAADVLGVTGAVSFGGGSTTGQITAGLLSLTGNFVQSNTATSFNASGTHQVVFAGGAPQTVNFASPGASQFAKLTIGNTGGVTILSNVVTASDLTVASPLTGATFGLTIGGQLIDVIGGTTVGAISFAGSPNPVAAATPAINSSVTFNTSSTLLANLTVTGGVNVNSASGNLTIGGHSLTINGSFGASNSGSLTMNNAADVVTVNGSVTFSGNSGAMTNGVLVVTGNFTQNTNATAFTAASPHITRFTGVAPTISFANPATSNFGTLQFQTSGAVTFATDAATSFDVWLKTGTTPSVVSGGHTVTVGRNLYDTTGGRWQVTNTTMSGAATIPRRVTSNMTFAANAIMTDSAIVTGNVLVSGASALLGMNGHYLKATGTFGTAAGGVLQMQHVNDSLIVKGNASFNGGSTAGQLTNGYFEFDGSSFVQGVNATAFSADAPHITWLWSQNAQTLALANPGAATSHFGNLYMQDTATVLASNIFLNGKLESGGQSSFHVEAGADQLVTSNGSDMRNVVFDNVRWKTAGTNGNALFPSLDNVTFQNISNTTAAQFDYEYSVTTNLSIPGFTFLTTPTGPGSYIKIVGPDTLTMSSTSPGSTGGFVNLSGNGAIVGWSNTDTWLGSSSNAWGNAANWSGGVPSAASDVLINPASFQPATGGAITVHNLTVSSGATLSVTVANLTVNGDIVVQPSAAIALNTSNVGVNAFGNVTTDTAGTTGVTVCQGPSAAAINLQAGAHNVTGKFCNLSIFGNYAAAGPIVVTGSGVTGGLNVSNAGANLTLAGNHVFTDHFSTVSAATLTMNNANDSLVVANTATFTGGATTGLLTAGNLSIAGPTFTAIGQAFDASGTHTTTFNGDNITVTVQTIAWGSAVANHGFQNLMIRNSAQHQFSGDQYTTGTMTFDVSNGGFGASGSYNIYVNTLTDNSTIVGGGWNGSTALHITGTDGNLPPILRVNTLIFDGGAPISLQNSITTNYITVDHNTGLNLNGHFLDLQGNYFTTQNGGYLVMQTAGDSIQANQFYFNGGSTAGLLTKGGLTVAGSVFGLFYQGYDAAHNVVAGTSATAFAATGTRVWLNPPFVTSVAFANPATGAAGSHFGFVQALSANPVSLRSNIFVDSLLLGNVVGQTWESDSSAQNIVRTITANGFSNSTTPMTLPAVAIVLNDGPAASNVQQLTFTNFPTISSGAVLTQNRSAAPPTVNNLSYAGFTFSGTGNFAFNAGTTTMTLGSSIVPAGACTSAVLLTGTGCH